MPSVPIRLLIRRDMWERSRMPRHSTAAFRRSSNHLPPSPGPPTSAIQPPAAVGRKAKPIRNTLGEKQSSTVIMPPTHPAEPGAAANTAVDAVADVHATADPRAKRRKMRKGTHSCWACKKRKEKCIFHVQTAVCIGCQRRGTRCVSQEFPDDLTEPPVGARQMGDRVLRVEALVEQLIQRLDNDEASACSTNDKLHKSARPDHGIPTPASADLEPTHNPPSRRTSVAPTSTRIPNPSAPDPDPIASRARPDNSGLLRLRASGADVPAGPARCLGLSQSLYDALPTPEDSDKIWRASYRSFYMFNELLTVSYQTLAERTMGSRERILTKPQPTAHPVILARHMLRLLHLLQQFHPNYEGLQDLSEPPQEILERLADTVMSRVSTQDRLLGSIEGLECVMLESMYHANGGNLRLSWTANRRALSLAQLMEFHQPGSQLRYQILDPNSEADPRSMWFHIVQYDCFLSLLLGLPQGFQPCNVATDALLANDTPLGRLERIHCAITARVLERNESKCQDFTVTQQIDCDLQKEARRFPSKWWLAPNLPNMGKHDEKRFWELKRLIVQISHYNILNRLHLPYMLRNSNDPSYQYSKFACVNASREILSRFLILRTFNQTYFSCRTPDFMALMAAMTLILVHLDSHRHSLSGGNLLAHQYLSDRAMMEQVQESSEELGRLNGDAFSIESADLLRRLLIIEAEAADGQTGRTEGVSIQLQGSGGMGHNEGDHSDGAVQVSIPYFGIIKIAREGIISKETGPMELSTSTQVPPLNNIIPETQLAVEPSGCTSVEQQSQNGLYDTLLPGLTAGADDWTFQGVDMAFFNSLINVDAHGEWADISGIAWQGDAA